MRNDGDSRREPGQPVHVIAIAMRKMTSVIGLGVSLATSHQLLATIGVVLASMTTTRYRL